MFDRSLPRSVCSCPKKLNSESKVWLVKRETPENPEFVQSLNVKNKYFDLCKKYNGGGTTGTGGTQVS